MRAFEFGRFALSVSAAAALLSACGGASIPRATDGAPSDLGAAKHNKTFKYTGGEQTFVVPKGVSQLTVVALGGEGAGFVAYPSTDTPGRPGRVYATIPVSPGDKLYVFVGGSGADGGFNGGGTGGAPSHGSYPGNRGGGASDVRAAGTGILDRIIVAAGGGGAGQANRTYGIDYGGNGGGLRGKNGGGGGASGKNGGGGVGGTQHHGGSGGAGGYAYRSSGGGLAGKPGGGGTLGLGGNGGNSGGYSCVNAGGGGGGGGGYYGGGGGGGAALNFYCYYSSQGGGGGGGSSYVEPNAIKSRMWTGWKSKGDGLVVFSWN